ncbi:MAG: hypothetical protein M5U12_00565 [Verrucomicrobia bacterium]|nr:hypothetical protein [Verrucomicrobiota bacterium]
MKTPRGWAFRWVQVGGGAVLLLLVLVVGYAGLLLDWQARPSCHKQVYLSLLQWQEDHHTSAFPTLDFLRTQQRPDWETAVAEHQRIIDSLNRHGH